MFRTRNARGLQRFKALRAAAISAKKRVLLTRGHLQHLEATSSLSIGEKVELLTLASGHKMAAEVYAKIQYQPDKTGVKLPTPESLEAIQQALRSLPFHFFLDSKTIKDRSTGQKQQLHWFQLAVNQNTLAFFKDYPDELTEFEEGVLYGFPLTAIRAFSGLIKASDTAPDNPWCYYLGGVFSKEWLEEEDEYYKAAWDTLRKISPAIIGEAELKYKI